MALPRFRKSAFEMVFELLLLPQLARANVHIAAMTKAVGTARVMKASTGVVETRESLTLALTDPRATGPGPTCRGRSRLRSWCSQAGLELLRRGALLLAAEHDRALEPGVVVRASQVAVVRVRGLRVLEAVDRRQHVEIGVVGSEEPRHLQRRVRLALGDGEVLALQAALN